MRIKAAIPSSRGYPFGMGKDPESPWGSKWPQADPHSLTTFGERLAAARRFRGLDQTRLAKMAQCSKGRISQIESGRPRQVDDVMTTLAFRLSDALEVSARWLVWGTGPVAKWEPLTPEEKEILTIYRALTPELRDYGKEKLLGLLGGPAPPSPSRAFPFTPHRAAHKPKK